MDEMEAQMSEEGAADGAQPDTRKHKGGRRASDIWEWFTEAEKPQNLNAAVCKHCKGSFAYYKNTFEDL